MKHITLALLAFLLAPIIWAAPVLRVPLQVDKDTSEIFGRTDFFEANKTILNDSVTNATFLDVTKAPFYATGDGETDDSDALQAAIDALGTHFKSLYLPAGRTFAISKPLVFQTGLSDPYDYLALTIKGNFSTLLVTAPTSAIKLKAKSIFWGNIEDLVISYTTNYSDPNAVAISYEGTGLGGPAYNNIYNVSHKNITILRGYYGFKQQEWCSIWGSSWENLFFSQEMTGGAMKLSTASAFGNPNNRIENAYARADKMVQPVFELNQQDSTVLRNIEVNLASNVPCIYISASYNSRIESSRLEVGWYNQDYTGPIFTANNAHFKVDGYTIQSVVWGMPLWGFAVRDVAAPPFASEGGMYLDGILFRNNQKTEANHVAVVASDYRRVHVGRIGFQVNDTNSLLTVPSSIPFASSASLSNVTGVAVSQSTNDIPRMRGLFTFDRLGNPYMSRGFSYVTDWHRLGEGDVFGASGSTDRALVLWDGATGKRLNNSLITVDTDWNMTIPGQALNFGPGYGNPLLNIRGSPNGVRGLRFFSGYDMRWEIVTSSGGETTNDNTGTDLEFRAYGISGTNPAAFLQTVGKFRRSNGRFVTRQPVEFGGLHITAPPTIHYWTNVSFSNPNGLGGDAVANPGSILLGLDGHVWKKTSGTGDVGWVEIGDATVLGTRTPGNIIVDDGTNIVSTNGIDGGKITSGTVAEARIDAAIARLTDVQGSTNITALNQLRVLNFSQGDIVAFLNGSITNLGRGTNGQVLATVVSGSVTNLVWTNMPVGTGGGGGATNLSDLADVDAASPATNSFLVWNGTAWVPTNITTLEVTELIASNIVDAPLTGNPTLNGTSLQSLIDGKQAADSDLDDLADGNLSESKIDSAITRDSEVTTAISASRTNFTAEQTIAQFSAIEFQPEVSNPATFGKRNGIGVMTYSPSVQQQACVVFPVPYGYTNTTMKVILHWCSSATSGNARWGAQFDKLTGVDIDSLSFATAVEATTATSGTAGLISTTTLDSVGLDSAAMGNFVALRVYRDTGDAADNMDSNTLELIGVEVRAK